MGVIYWILLIPFSVLVLYFFYHLMFQEWEDERMLPVLIVVNILSIIWQVLVVLRVK